MGEHAALTVERWNKYGKRRLYVNAADGQRVGWVDLVTGAQTVEQPRLAAEFQIAIGPHLEAAPPSETVAVTLPTNVPVTPPWTDLAERRPGQGVREEAATQLAAMKERSPIRTYIGRVLDSKTDERAFRVGAEGEETVGVRLEKLIDRGWYVLHSVPVGKGKSDIDHVLIGPGGVYTINTKKHPGKSVWVGRHAVLVDGHQTDYLRNSRFEAERASRLLAEQLGHAVPVAAVLVILTGTLIPSITYKQRPDDVHVLDWMDVPRVFKRAQQRLTPDEVARIYDVARRSTTWSG